MAHLADSAAASAYEMGKRNLLVFRGCASGFDSIQEPRYILCQCPHGLKSLGILGDIFRREAVYLIPVLRGRYYHIGHLKIHIEPRKCRRCAPATAGHHGCGNLSCEPFACTEHEAIEKAREPPVRAAVVNRRANNHAVKFVPSGSGFIYQVIEHAFSRFPTFVAGNAVLHRLLAKPEDFGLHIKLAQFVGNFLQRGESAAFFIGTAVD